jgi:hypothetical protein
MPAVLMTLEDVVADLNLESLDVLRLIARGTLAAQVVGDDAYRILQADVERVASSNDLKAPRVHGPTNWIDDRPETMRANEFAAGVKTIIEDWIPESDPGADRTVTYSKQIAELGNAPPKPLMRAVFGDRTLPYRTPAELYVVSKVRLHAAQNVNNKALNARVQGKRPRSKMETLYANPETYQRIVSQAIAAFARRSIFIRNSYETGERRFSLLHSAIPFDVQRVELLAF